MIKLITEGVTNGSGTVIEEKAAEILEPYKKQLELEKNNITRKRYQRLEEKIKYAEDVYSNYAQAYNSLAPNAHIEKSEVLLNIGTGKCHAYDIDTWSRNFYPAGVIIPYRLEDGRSYRVSCAYDYRKRDFAKIIIGTSPEEYSDYDRRSVLFASAEDAEMFARKYSLIGVKPVKLVNTNKFSKNLQNTFSDGGLLNLKYGAIVNQDNLTFFISAGSGVVPYYIEVEDTRDVKDSVPVKNKRGPGFKSSVINRIVSKYNTERPHAMDAGDEYANDLYEFEIGDAEVSIVRYERGPSSNRAKNCISLYISKGGETVFNDDLYLDEYNSDEDQFKNVLAIIDEYVG